MKLYLLDTDHLSLYQRGQAAVREHILRTLSAQLALAVITAEELLRGRLAQIRAAKNEGEHLKSCYWLGESLELLQEFAILPYDRLASQHYQTLRQQNARRLTGFTHRCGGTGDAGDAGDSQSNSFCASERFIN